APPADVPYTAPPFGVSPFASPPPATGRACRWLPAAARRMARRPTAERCRGHRPAERRGRAWRRGRKRERGSLGRRGLRVREMVRAWTDKRESALLGRPACRERALWDRRSCCL